MKVLQIIPALNTGGAERAVIDVSAALVAAGHESYVISNGGKMVADVERLGGKHIHMPSHTKNPLVMMANYGRLKKIIRELEIDIIHARSRAPAWTAYFAAKACKIGFVTTCHAPHSCSNFLKTFYNRVLAKGDRVISISHFVTDYLQKNFALPSEKIALIHRGIDFSIFSPDAVSGERKEKLRAVHNLQEGVPLIIFPARLSPTKGQRDAIHALAEIKDENFHCLIIGPDQGKSIYRAELQQLIAQHGLEEKIHLVPQTDLVAAYACADLVLSTSSMPEGFGRVPVEAGAFGIPVIATALGATNETIIDGVTGYLVPMHDVKMLAHTIKKCLHMPADDRRIMGMKAMRHVHENFDVKKMVAETLEVYHKVLGRA